MSESNIELPSIFGNKTRGQWKMLSNPKNGFNSDVHGASGSAETRNFGGKDYDFEFETGFNQKVTKIFFEVKDKLTDGTNLTISDVTGGAPNVAVDCARSFNHIACLFNQCTVEINGTQVDNVNLLAEVDSYAKRKKYSQAFMDNFGAISSLQSYSARKAEAEARLEMSKLWICDAVPLLSEEEIPQNCRVRITLKSDSNYHLRAVTSPSNIANGVTNITWKYSVQGLKMYYYVEDCEHAPIDQPLVIDYRPYYASAESFSATDGQFTKNYTVRKSAYELGVAVASSIRNSSATVAPSEFKTAGNAERINKLQISYASNNYPSHSIDQVLTADANTGFMLSYIETMTACDKLLNDAGGISYENWETSPFWVYDCIKPENDISTNVEVTVNPLSGSGVGQLILFNRSASALIFNYDKLGNLYEVKREM